MEYYDVVQGCSEMIRELSRKCGDKLPFKVPGIGYYAQYRDVIDPRAVQKLCPTETADLAVVLRKHGIGWDQFGEIFYGGAPEEEDVAEFLEFNAEHAEDEDMDTYSDVDAEYEDDDRNSSTDDADDKPDDTDDDVSDTDDNTEGTECLGELDEEPEETRDYTTELSEGVDYLALAKEAVADIMAAWNELQKAFQNATRVGDSYLSLEVGYMHPEDDRCKFARGGLFMAVSGVYQVTPAGQKFWDQLMVPEWRNIHNPFLLGSPAASTINRGKK